MEEVTKVFFIFFDVFLDLHTLFSPSCRILFPRIKRKRYFFSVSFSIMVRMKMNECEKKKQYLTFHPTRDIILYSSCIFLIVFTFLFALFSKSTSKENTYVEIRYKDTLLYEKDDKEKNTKISFPEEGEKKITFQKEDASFYIEGLQSFDFMGESVTITLYSDKSIQILKDEITCNDHVCSKMGRIDKVDIPIVCLVNHIQVMIRSSTGLPENVN